MLRAGRRRSPAAPLAPPRQTGRGSLAVETGDRRRSNQELPAGRAVDGTCVPPPETRDPPARIGRTGTSRPAGPAAPRTPGQGAGADEKRDAHEQADDAPGLAPLDAAALDGLDAGATIGATSRAWAAPDAGWGNAAGAAGLAEPHDSADVICSPAALA
jgi:hypothetical protein